MQNISVTNAGTMMPSKIRTLAVACEKKDTLPVNQIASIALVMLEGGPFFGRKISNLPIIVFWGKNLKDGDKKKSLPAHLNRPDVLVFNHHDGYFDKRAQSEGRQFETILQDFNLMDSPFHQCLFHDLFMTSDKESLGAYLSDKQRFLEKEHKKIETRIREIIKLAKKKMLEMRECFEITKDDYNAGATSRTFMIGDEERGEELEIIKTAFISSFHRNIFLQANAHKLQTETAHVLIHHFSAENIEPNFFDWNPFKEPNVTGRRKYMELDAYNNTRGRRNVTISLVKNNRNIVHYLCERLNEKEKQNGSISKVWEIASDKMLVTREGVKTMFRREKIFDFILADIKIAFLRHYQPKKKLKEAALDPVMEIQNILHDGQKPILTTGCI